MLNFVQTIFPTEVITQAPKELPDQKAGIDTSVKTHTIALPLPTEEVPGLAGDVFKIVKRHVHIPTEHTLDNVDQFEILKGIEEIILPKRQDELVKTLEEPNEPQKRRFWIC